MASSPDPIPLIDRVYELEAMRSQLLSESVRLRTLLGPGGIGKMRLALAAAENPIARHTGDVDAPEAVSMSRQDVVETGAVLPPGRKWGRRRAPGFRRRRSAAFALEPAGTGRGAPDQRGHAQQADRGLSAIGERTVHFSSTMNKLGVG